VSGQNDAALVPELSIVVEVVKTLPKRGILEGIVTKIKKTLLEGHKTSRCKEPRPGNDRII
jgi:hypothetical protein